MQVRDLFHGTNGDNIIAIIREGQVRPNRDRKIFFAEQKFDSVLMHGADTRRKATFAVKLRVIIPPTAAVARVSTPGVDLTLVVTTTAPLKAEVLEMYVREPGAITVKTFKSRTEILNYLKT
jgi:hypothetical protein